MSTLRLAQRKVLVDNDWAGDPDGLVALAHHLLSPTDDVCGVTSSGTSPIFGDPTGSAECGANLTRDLTILVGQDVRIAGGSDVPFMGEARLTPAAKLIGELGRRHPLTLVCGGPLTNVADAVASFPDLAENVMVAWVGGAIDPGRDEYNRDTDPAAAEYVLEHCQVTSYPVEVYRSLAVSIAELEWRLTACGSQTGRWLWQRFEKLPLPDFVDVDPVWPLGDSAPLAQTALPHGTFERVSATHARCTSIDARLIVEDFFARLGLHERRIKESRE